MAKQQVKRILVTGSNGFLGKNLIKRLKSIEMIEVYEYDVKNSLKELECYCTKCDYIFHFAAIQRTDDEKLFDEVNYGLTKTILDYLIENENNPKILFSSSIHASKKNAFGISKSRAEKLLENYALNQEAKVNIIRFSNIFGPFGKPNFNNVVSTFIYNVINELPILVNNPCALIKFIYVDDVIKYFINEFIVYEKDEHTNKFPFSTFTKSVEVRLSYVLDCISQVHLLEKTDKEHDTKNDFLNSIKSTYKGYL